MGERAARELQQFIQWRLRARRTNFLVSLSGVSDIDDQMAMELAAVLGVAKAAGAAVKLLDVKLRSNTLWKLCRAFSFEVFDDEATALRTFGLELSGAQEEAAPTLLTAGPMP